MLVGMCVSDHVEPDSWQRLQIFTHRYINCIERTPGITVSAASRILLNFLLMDYRALLLKLIIDARGDQ